MYQKHIKSIFLSVRVDDGRRDFLLFSFFYFLFSSFAVEVKIIFFYNLTPRIFPYCQRESNDDDEEETI